MKKFILNKTGLSIACALFVVGIISSCDVANKSGVSKKVSVDMQVATLPMNKLNMNTIQQTDSVALSNIKLLVRKLELKSEGEFENGQETEGQNTVQDEQGDENDQGNSDSEEFELKNQIFDLPLSGDAVSVSTGQIPAGAYSSIEVKIGPAEQGSGLQDPDLIEGDADSLRYSMAISGTYAGNTFTFKTHNFFKIEMALNPPVVVADTTQNVDVNLMVDPSGWFKNSQTGEFLDPTNPDNHDMIEANIAHSFKAEHHDEDEHEGMHEED